VGTTPHDADFLRFLVAEGLVDDATIPTGTDRGERARDVIAALPADVLAAAREKFAQLAGTEVGATVPSPKATDPLVGRVIGGCRIEGLLGAGGMGAVYRATQLSIDRPVACKVQKGEPLPELVERFRSEARLLGRLRSPHIVEVYDVGTESGLQFFVMEFMPGGSLSGHVRGLPEQKLPNDAARRMLIECCLGLAEAAEHGVLHRDIKPDNLLLDARGTVKIADFGIAKLLDAEYGLTQTGFSPGTPAFKSPEQVAASELDFRTDMYSLGVSFWMLRTGARPVDSLTRQERLEQLPEPPPFSAPEVALTDGDPLLLVICRMMALKRADRFGSWQDLIAALRALPAEGAAAPASVQPAPRAKRPWPAVVVLAAACALAIVIWPRDDVARRDDGGRAVSGKAEATSMDTIGAGRDVVNDTAAGDHALRPPAPGPQPAGDRERAPAPQDPPSTTLDVDAAARKQFFGELAAPLPTSPRTATEVEAQRTRLRARASALGVADDRAVIDIATALERELAAATARDELLRVTALATFEQHAQLAAAAAAIELPAYRDDAERHVHALFAARPLFLRVADADVAWLRTWADWEPSDANTSQQAGRPLPTVVRDRSRDGRMVLVCPAGAEPAYLDATEVSLSQWRASGHTVDGLQGPDGDDAPVRFVTEVDVDAFLAGHALRLPTVAEFRAALGTRDGDTWWWGNTAPPGERVPQNLADRARHGEVPTAPYLPDFDDGVASLAPVDDVRFAQGDGGRFRHLLGNVAETCVENGRRVVLGGSFLTSTWDALRADQRMPVVNPRRQDIGFRAARTFGR
jgi:serine/threonine-protein kinase